MKKELSTLKKNFFLFVLAVITMPAFSQSAFLQGSWRLIAADRILPGGSREADFGNAPHGIAIFTADGHYVVEIFQANRMKFTAADSTKITPGQYTDAIGSLSCHFGTYTVDSAKGIITFHIDRASYANWDGTTQVRNFTLEGDTLTWRVPPRPDGSIPVSAFSRMH